MMKYISTILLFLLTASPVFAAGDSLPPKKLHWSFEGMTGTFDRRSIQRGFQVYKEVCATCHSLRLLSYRNLIDVGFSEAEVKAIAAEAIIIDGPDDLGDMFERPGKPSDRFVSPFPNDKAAAAANGGAVPPDLSLIVKARMDGANYLYSLLTGYKDAPKDVSLDTGQYYNPYFPGTKIAMAPPIVDDIVSYMDNTPATEDQIARDLVHFLQWTAEPEMEQRKGMGIKVLLFLLVFTALFIVANRRTWKGIKK